jgi:hypothetical protein
MIIDQIIHKVLKSLGSAVKVATAETMTTPLLLDSTQTERSCFQQSNRIRGAFHFVVDDIVFGVFIVECNRFHFIKREICFDVVPDDSRISS